MKATLYIYGIAPEQRAHVAIKLQQWQEFLEAAGMIASFAIEDEARPAADLWQVAQEDIPTIIEAEAGNEQP